MQAGGRPIDSVSFACELPRDWARETAAGVVQIVLTERLLKE